MQRDIGLQCHPVSLERIRWIPRRRGPQKADTPDLIISLKEDYLALRERERGWRLATYFLSHSYSFLEPCFSILSPHHIPHFPFVLAFSFFLHFSQESWFFYFLYVSNLLLSNTSLFVGLCHSFVFTLVKITPSFSHSYSAALLSFLIFPSLSSLIG